MLVNPFKPDRRIYERALELLQVQPHQAVMVAAMASLALKVFISYLWQCEQATCHDSQMQCMQRDLVHAVKANTRQASVGPNLL